MKYMPLIVVVLVSMLAPAAIASGQQAAAGAPPQNTLPIFRDYATPPSSMDRLVASADAVVVVRIDGIRFESVQNRFSGRAEDVTRYDVRVLETLKGYGTLPADGGTLTLTRVGGRHTEGGKTVRSAVVGFEDFRSSEEYVLFLTWNQQTNGFDIAYGPDGCYDVSSGTVRPLGGSGLARSQLGASKDAFLKQVRPGSGR